MSARYVGLFPWMAHGGSTISATGPWYSSGAVRVTAGRQCRNAIGEVKTDTERVMAMSRNEHPEVETDWTPIAAPTAAELAQELAELDAQVLRYTGGPGDGSIVYKRSMGPCEVAPSKTWVTTSAASTGGAGGYRRPMSFSRTVADTPGVTATYWAHRVPE